MSQVHHCSLLHCNHHVLPTCTAPVGKSETTALQSEATHYGSLFTLAQWLLEGSNSILLNALKQLYTPSLGEDDYAEMQAKDISRNWPDRLDATIKNLSDHILPALKYLPNELLLGLLTNSSDVDNLEDIRPPTDVDVAVHLALIEQQQLDGYSAIIDHAAKCEAPFDAKLLKCALREVKVGDLV
jgi:hypothetical protein